MTLKIGAHMSISKGFYEAVRSGFEEVGANSIQIFLKSPRGRFEKPLDPKDADACKEYVQKNTLFLVGHCSYLLNFAKDPTLDSWPVDSLVSDIKKIAKLGGVGVVLHIGKYVDMNKSDAFVNIKKSVELVLKRTQDTNMFVIFENTAGQGTEIGFRFEELKEIYDLFTDTSRIRFCLDTCHLFAAGYDLRTPAAVENTFKTFDEVIGIKNILCFHFNDAKKQLGSRVDRHESIGYGHIGADGLKHVVQFAHTHNIPLILETPEKTVDYKSEITMIKQWV